MLTISFFIISLNKINIRMTWTAQEKSQTLAEYHFNLSVTFTQRWVCIRMNKEPLTRNAIRQWERNFQNRRSMVYSIWSERPRSSDQVTTQVQDLFQETPTLRIRAGERQLNILRSSIQWILRLRIQYTKSGIQ